MLLEALQRAANDGEADDVPRADDVAAVTTTTLVSEEG